MKKPRLNNPGNKPLSALAEIIDKHEVGTALSWSFLKDEWFHTMGNKDEEWKLGEWLEFALSTEVFRKALVQARSDKYSASGNNVYRYLDLVIIDKVNLKERSDGIAV